MNRYYLNLVVFISFFIYPSLIFIPINLFNVNFNTMDDALKTLYLISVNTIYLSALLLIYHKDMTKYLNDFKINGKEYIQKTIKYWYFGLFIMITSNLIINTFLPVDMAENEQIIRRLLSTLPIYIIFSTIIFAPIVEELICRGIIRKFINNKYSFVIISSIIFGGAHIITSYSTWWSYFYIIPYGALGGAFALAFYNTNNLLTPIFLHALHNTILISLYIIFL